MPSCVRGCPIVGLTCRWSAVVRPTKRRYSLLACPDCISSGELLIDILSPRDKLGKCRYSEFGVYIPQWLLFLVRYDVFFFAECLYSA